MTEAEATHFARQWVAAWNSHDLEEIMSHYSDDAELISPLAEQLLGRGVSAVQGKTNLRGYFRRGLEAFPDLKFTLLSAYTGVQSVVVSYQSVRGMETAEVMRLNEEGRVCRVIAHYFTPAPIPDNGSARA